MNKATLIICGILAAICLFVGGLIEYNFKFGIPKQPVIVQGTPQTSTAQAQFNNKNSVVHHIPKVIIVPVIVPDTIAHEAIPIVEPKYLVYIDTLAGIKDSTIVVKDSASTTSISLEHYYQIIHSVQDSKDFVNSNWNIKNNYKVQDVRTAPTSYIEKEVEVPKPFFKDMWFWTTLGLGFISYLLIHALK